MWGERYWAKFWGLRYWGKRGGTNVPEPEPEPSPTTAEARYSLALAHKVRQVERKFTRLGGIHAAIPSPHVAGRLQVQTDPQRVEAIERFLTTVPPQKHTRLTGSVTGSGVLKCAGEMTALTADESLLLLAVLMEN